MTQKEKIKTFEAFMSRLHFHRTMTLDHKKEAAMLKLIDEWVISMADAAKSGQPDKKIDKAYETLKDLP